MHESGSGAKRTSGDARSVFANGRIVLKKSSLTAERNFSGPPVRPSCGDVRDHIASHKNDHRLSYRSWRALQRRSLLKIDFREIFAAARFSTFATVSGGKRTS
jgi:hypothetical protein